MGSAAIVSFLTSQFLSKDNQLTFYQGHARYYNGYSGLTGPFAEDNSTNYNISMENFGVEREFSKWFSAMLEANLQEMYNPDYFTVGGGLKAYFRWTALRKYPLHPYFEYGAGIFYALKKFPEDGSNLTFNLNYALGAEYVLKDKNKIRFRFQL